MEEEVIIETTVLEDGQEVAQLPVLTKEQERAAKKAAAKAAKDAEKAAKATAKAAERLERVRKLEAETKEANDKADEARTKKAEMEGKRKREVIEEQLSIEERRDKEVEKLHSFYEAKLDKNGNLVIELSNLKIVDLLRNLGFYRFDQPGGGFEYVRIRNNKIRLVRNTQEIIDAFENYVRELPDRKIELWHEVQGDRYKVEKTIFQDLLLDKVYKNLTYYFSSTLPRLRPHAGSEVKEITTVNDTYTSKYIFYNNVALRITREGVEEIEYKDLNSRIEEIGEENGCYVWDNGVINRDYHRLGAGDFGEFGNFVLYICGGANCDSSKTLEKRRKSLMSILGYLLHNNFETDLVCPLFTDAAQKGGKASGGTGKGILGKALRLMLNRNTDDAKYINVNGKDFDPRDERRYSSGDITTQLVHIEDADKNIDFEQLFFDITEGATFRKMYQDKTTHQVKLMLSTNTPFDISAPSTRRRVCLFELDNFFNEKRRPQDIFGHQFFGTVWSKEQWNKFDNFMVSCCALYMREGLIEAEMVGYKDNLVRSKLGEDFCSWVEEYFKDALLDSDKTEHIYPIPEIWEKFIFKYPDMYNKRKTLTTNCKFWLVTYGIRSGIRRGTDDELVIYPDKTTKIGTWFVE